MKPKFKQKFRKRHIAIYFVGWIANRIGRLLTKIERVVKPPWFIGRRMLKIALWCIDITLPLIDYAIRRSSEELIKEYERHHKAGTLDQLEELKDLPLDVKQSLEQRMRTQETENKCSIKKS